MPPTEPLDAAAALFKVLSSSSRLAILRRLEQGPSCVHELVTDLQLTQPLVSQHLRVLRSADLVRGTRRGREITYEVADTHVSHLVHDALAHAAEPSSTIHPHDHTDPDDHEEHTA